MILTWFFPNVVTAYIFLASILCLLCFYFNKPSKLLFLQVLFVLQLQYYVGLKLLPAQVSYLSDLIVMLLFCHFINRMRSNEKKQNGVLIYRVLFIFLIYILLGIMCNVLYQFNPILILWSLRNVGRIILFFVSALLFISKEDIEVYKEVGAVFLWTCGILSALQYINGYKGDWLGGIFGIQQGVANIYLHAFLIIFLVYLLTNYFFGKVNWLFFLISLSYIIGLAIVSELKFLFFELFYVAFLVILFKRLNIKVFVRFLSSTALLILLVMVSIPIFVNLFPNFSNFFSVESFLRTSTSAGGLGVSSLTIGRGNFFSYVTNNFFKNDIFKILFGIGMGSAEYSMGQQMLTSSFFNKFYYSLYFWYSSAWMYIENGLVGMFLYVLMFIQYAKRLYVLIENHVVGAFSFILTLCLPLFYFYNSTLRLDVAYIVIVALALGSVYCEATIEANMSNE